MINLSRAKMVHGRLGAAIRRHGLATVSGVVLSALFRHGLVGTLRLGGAERPFPWNRDKGVQAHALAARFGAPPDLDEAYTLDAHAWDCWRGVIGSGAPAAKSGEPVATLVFIVQGETDDPQALERTRAAVAAMAPHADMWSSGAPPPAGRDAVSRWWVFLRPGDLPSLEMSRALAQAAQGGLAEVISFDLVRREGVRVQPLLFPGANPTLLQAVDYMFSRVALADSMIEAVADLGTAEPRTLILQWMQGRPAQQVRGRWRHVGRPLVEATVADEEIQAARRQVLEQNRMPARPYVGEPITVVICTRDKGHLTRQLVRGLLAEDPGLVGEVVIVSNNTANPYALATLEDLGREPRVQVLRRDAPFNFSKLCNSGAASARGRGPLLFLNDDITPVSEDWLQRLGGRLEDPEVGSAGPLLLYPDERVQHAGMYLGHGGTAGHVLRAGRLPEDDYLVTGCAPREVSALTGAVLLTPRWAFEALGGFDEQLSTYLQDVDYCLRLKGIGLLNIFEPASILIHMESASIRAFDGGAEFQRKRLAERARFHERWGERLTHDRLHPRGFDIEDETLRRLSGTGGQRPKSAGKRT